MSDHEHRDVLGFKFSEFDEESRDIFGLEMHSPPVSCLQFGVYDEDGVLIGITVKLGSLPVMMFRVEPIPDDAVRFDGDRPRDD